MGNRIIVLTLAILASAACGSEFSSSEPDGPSGTGSGGKVQVCAPGQSVACTGPGGCQGGQTCSGDGAGFGECTCAQAQSSASSGASSGTGGDPCASLNCDDQNPCTKDICVGGKCSSIAVSDGQVQCKGAGPGFKAGICYLGSCCTGCWKNGFSCSIGTEPGACGQGGGPCADCNDGSSCTTDTCVAGTGTCAYAGTCSSCGSQGQQCCPGSICYPGASCKAGTCYACGGNGQSCCPNVPIQSACGSDLACIDGYCHCGNLDQPCCLGYKCNTPSCVNGSCQ